MFKLKTIEGIKECPPYKHQEELCAAFEENKNVIILNTRQTGMTTALVLEALGDALVENKSVALVSPKLGQSRNHQMIARDIISLNGREDIKYTIKDCIGHMVFDGGGLIFFINDSPIKIKGTTINTLICDDFAFYTKQEEFTQSMFPVVASGKKGKIIISSVPNGDNHFKELYQTPNNFTKYFIHWSDIEGRDEVWKARMIEVMGVDVFEREYEGSFE